MELPTQSNEVSNSSGISGVVIKTESGLAGVKLIEKEKEEMAFDRGPGSVLLV